MTPQSANDVLIQLSGIRKSYFSGDVETPVLHGVDVTIKHGEFVAIMGQSGSGKSTLMNILGGARYPNLRQLCAQWS